MSYEGYEKDLYHIYESEVLGETMFGLIATLTLSAERARKWQRLAALETQTMQRYLDFVADKPALRDKPKPGKGLAYVYGLLFAVLPWRTAMKMLSQGTDAFMEVFKRLAEHAAPDEAEFFDYVVAHEEAIKAFAELELDGEYDLSLQPVSELLNS